MIDIVDKTQCCGCTACVNKCPQKCINMVYDDEGFMYPNVNVKECIRCELCNKVCPVLNHKNKSEINQVAAVVQHKDRDVLSQSTSGGAFTGIAEYTIDHGGVVIGAAFGSDYVVRHIVVDNKKDLFKFRNSKYVQSYLGNVFALVKKKLDSNQMVCFSGTPCQIEGLRYYLGKEYDNLVLVDVVCRAVPSPGLWKKYVSMEQRKLGGKISVRFRDKSLGYQYSTMVIENDKSVVYRGGIESQPWLRMYFSGMIIRPSCTECKFRGRYRNSDFTIWDCYNVYKYDKSFNEDDGVTRVLIHSSKGRHIFNQIKNNYKYKMIDPDKAVDGVNEMVMSPKEHIKKKEFFHDCKCMPISKVLKKYYALTVMIRVKRAARIILSKLGLDKRIKHVLKKGN